jgi:hypothetical protein
VNTSASVGALGIYAESGSPSQGASEGGEAVRAKAASRRYELQSAARVLLPGERVAGCLRWVQDGSASVDVFHIIETQSARFGGLQTCGSPWACPVCSSKISERRKVDLRAGIATWESQGGCVVLVTYTLRHDLADDLAETLVGLLRARHAATTGKSWMLFKGRWLIAGSVRSIEVTSGSNGWHPHIHELLFLDGAQPDTEALRVALLARWSQAVEKAGLKSVNDHGVDVQAADLSVAEYVEKYGKERTWGAESELTKHSRKTGRWNNASPVDWLAEFCTTGDYLAGDRYVEYATVFKGQRQLVWSRGLRTLCGLGTERSDAALAAAASDNTEVLLASITLAEWRIVLANDARATVHNLAAAGDRDALAEYIVSLRWASGAAAVTDHRRSELPSWVDRAKRRRSRKRNDLAPAPAG